jgi:hypothetical protein
MAGSVNHAELADRAAGGLLYPPCEPLEVATDPPGITEHEVATAALLDEPPQVAITRQVISGSDDHDPHSPLIDGAPTLGVDRDRPISRAQIGRYSSALQAVSVEVTHELTDGLEAWVVAVVPRHEYHTARSNPASTTPPHETHRQAMQHRPPSGPTRTL